MRCLQALKDDGSYIVNDLKGLPTPALNFAENLAAAMMYGFSCHCCLPSGPHPRPSMSSIAAVLAPDAMRECLLHVRHYRCIHALQAVYVRCARWHSIVHV